MASSVNSIVYHTGTLYSMSVKITNIKKVREGIIREALIAINRVLKSSFADNLKKEISDLVLEAFERNDVILGLQGFFAGDEDKDLQAIFGLTDELANQIIEEMRDLIANKLNVKFTIGYSKNQIRYNVTIVYEDLTEEAKSLDAANYNLEIKKRTGGTVEATLPWFEWLINGADVQAEIVFDLNDTQASVSRSGRAIMLSNAYYSGNWSWQGINFIEEIVKDEEFINKLELIVRNKLIKEIDQKINK